MKPTVICLTPVKNEEWIIERFIKCTQLWADLIIFADQGSTDQTREIIKKFNNTILINNPDKKYSEKSRQAILLKAARKISEPRLLISLDADEFLTANFLNSPEWQTVLEAKPGTLIRFQWANIFPGIEKYWVPDFYFAWGFMDDNSEHTGSFIHSPRLPVCQGSNSIYLSKIKVLHYNYVDRERFNSKHRWYQCIERIERENQSGVDVYRRYHHYDAFDTVQLREIPQEWFENYRLKGIDMTSVPKDSLYWWDKEVINLFVEFGNKKFRKEAIWDYDWLTIVKQISPGGEIDINCLYDARNLIDKIFHKILKLTQKSIFNSFLACKIKNCIDSLIKLTVL